jgi:hypothetical protein
MKCKKCGAEMKGKKDDHEPLIIYRCKCGEIEFERLNNYEG